MSVLVDLAGVTTATTGTGGPLVLGAALVGHRTLVAANAAGQLPTGSVLSYTILNGNEAESCSGVYNSTLNTLTRVFRSSTTGAPLNLAGVSEVIVAANAGDFYPDNTRLAPRSGQWFGERSETGSGAIFGDTTILYTPIIIPRPTTVDRIGLPMQSGGASMFAKCAIFDSTIDRIPGPKIADCASPIVLDGYGFKTGTFSVNPPLQAGLHWIGTIPNSPTPQPKVAAGWASFFAQNSIFDFNQYWSESNVAFYQTTTYAAGLPAVATPVMQIGWNTNVALLRAL